MLSRVFVVCVLLSSPAMANPVSDLHTRQVDLIERDVVSLA